MSPLQWAVSSLTSMLYGAEHDTPAATEIQRATYSDHVVSRLHHYDNKDVPPSARVDPSLSQRVAPPFKYSSILQWGVLFARKSTEIASELFAHHVWGPRRKSWGIEMTIITTVMRGAASYSHIASLGMLRGILSVLGYAPIPSDAMVTPVTFTVRRRKLKGLLAEGSLQETGIRELSGEWVVGRNSWKRMQAEWRDSRKNSGLFQAGPNEGSFQRERKDRVILYIHGGAFYMFSASTHRIITIQLSKALDARLFALDYRLAPETRFPGQLLDVVSAYMRFLEDLHIPAENIVVAGDSAGGALALALLMYLRDNGYPLPSGAILMSPWCDLTMSCDSWDSNEPYDIIPRPVPGDHLHPILCYLGQEGIGKYLTHPYVSPLFGNFSGLPPLLIQCGDAEVLRDEITLLAHKATRAGVKVRHEIYEDCVHVFQTFPFLDASRRAYLSARVFFKRDLPAQQKRSPKLLDDVAQAGLEHEMDNEKTRSVAADGREDDSKLSTDVHEDEASEGSTAMLDDVESIASSSSTTLADSAEQLPFPNDSASINGTTPRPILQQLSLRTPTYKSHITAHAPTVPSTPNTLRHQRSTNHVRRGSQNVGINRQVLTMSPCISTAPQPSIRARNRALSHPDIQSLCQDWAERGPANETTLYSPVISRTSRI